MPFVCSGSALRHGLLAQAGRARSDYGKRPYQGTLFFSTLCLPFSTLLYFSGLVYSIVRPLYSAPALLYSIIGLRYPILCLSLDEASRPFRIKASAGAALQNETEVKGQSTLIFAAAEPATGFSERSRLVGRPCRNVSREEVNVYQYFRARPERDPAKRSMFNNVSARPVDPARENSTFTNVVPVLANPTRESSLFTTVLDRGPQAAPRKTHCFSLFYCAVRAWNLGKLMFINVLEQARSTAVPKRVRNSGCRHSVAT
jgi:hypothetical protein